MPGALKEAGRRLRPGGKLVFSDVCPDLRALMGYCCSQILAMAVLDAAGQDEPGLVASVSGLCGGVAWSGEGTCACLTGGACVLSYFTGSNQEREADKENFQPSLWDYLDWFSEKMDGKLGCMDILGREKGFTFFQLNTNGVRLTKEEGYAKKMAEAGVGVAQQWSGKASCCDGDEATSAPDEFLQQTVENTFTVSGMVFQDAWNLDLERLKRCCICEVDTDRGMVPFCAYNLTDIYGRSLYRR